MEFLGLDVLGQTTPTLLKDGSVEIPVHLALPEPLGGLGGIGNITGDITLKADVEKGLQLSHLHIHADHVGIGIAEINPLDIDYIGDPSKLYGKVNLILPVIESALETEFQFTAGSFDFGRAKLTFPGQGVAVASGVFLKAINFGIFLKPKPTKITGGVQVNALGQIAGTAVLQVDGQVTYTFPNAPSPGVFRVDGHGKLIGIDFADVFAQYETSGKISFGGDVHLGNSSTLGITGGAHGAVDVNTLQFTLLGTGHVCAFTICALGSEIGINNSSVAGCVGGSTVGAGAKYVFATKTLSGFWSCDLGAYKSLASSRISQSGVRSGQREGRAEAGEPADLRPGGATARHGDGTERAEHRQSVQPGSAGAQRRRPPDRRRGVEQHGGQPVEARGRVMDGRAAARFGAGRARSGRRTRCPTRR